MRQSSCIFFLFFFISNCADIIEDIFAEFVLLYLYHCSIITRFNLPDRDVPIAPEITSNPKFSSFFDDVIGAIDGTQVNCIPSSTELQNACNCKGDIMHNVLACCSFDLQFQYFFSGSDRIAANSGMFNRA
jgi:hypothetical protein